ncbi:MAG: HAD family hydrolase [Christensenellaceae bacterium]|jgi:Cof subfamily protein (haloacid dehalogenase superfamily)
MAYKLIAIDLDGTLLNKDQKISQENKASITKAKQAGIEIVLASGRSYESIDRYNKELGLSGYTIATAGGFVADGAGKIVYSSYMPPLAALQIMRWAALRELHFQVYMDDGFYYMQPNRFLEEYEKVVGIKGHADPSLLDRKQVLAAKIVLIDEPSRLRQYREELAAHFPEMKIGFSMPNFLEIMHPETDKGHALKYIADKLSVEQPQIIAIGDSDIDCGMLEYAGLGVATGNATRSLQKAANYICTENDDKCVSEVINKYIMFYSA